MGLRFTLFCVFWLILSSGCATHPANRRNHAHAVDYTGNGLFQKKPTQKQQIDRQRANQAWLRAALALVDQNRPDEAKREADKIELIYLTPYEQAQLNLSYAQIDLSHARAESALQRLRAIKYVLLTPADQIVYLRAKAFAWSLTGNLIDSAKARIVLQALLKDTRQQYDNKVATLETLRLLSIPALQVPQDSKAPILSGWMALASLLKTSPQLAVNDANLMRWRTAFPKHPANGAFLTAYLTPFQGVPNSIALLLPASGPYGQAAAAIKAGFMAAYTAGGVKGIQPQIRFYDSTDGDQVGLYRQAVDKGAQLVIGPLNKEHVQQLALNASNLEVPVLTLNHIPDLNKINFYQFALSPIDDAEQVSRQIIADGHKKVALLTPTTELGERIQGYFKSALKNADGVFVKAKTYNPESHNYAETLTELLNIHESEQRFAQLNRIIPGLQYRPRKRQDIEAIAMTAYPQNAHELRTQLQALGAGNIPLYATSHVYNGVMNPGDFDLNGVIFCDIPWFFNASYPGNLSQEALRPIWQKYPDVYLPLIAMGIDAYNLVPYLNKLGSSGYQGASGHLRLTGDNRIERRLVCAKFNHTRPQLLSAGQNR